MKISVQPPLQPSVRACAWGLDLLARVGANFIPRASEPSLGLFAAAARPGSIR